MSMERNNFIGKNVPSEIKFLIKSIKKIDLVLFQKIISVALKMLSMENPNEESFDKLTLNIDRNLIKSLYPGVLMVIQQAVRLPPKKLKKVDFVHDLKEINMPEKCVEAFATALYGEKRHMLDDVMSRDRPRFPSVEEFRWRIDVGISTTSLKRVLEPSILCRIKTSSDEDCTFEASKEKFHELRYAVSEVLNHMQQLEKRSILNIET